MVRIGRRPEYRFEIRSFNMQTHHSRDIWPAFNPLKPVGKDGIRSHLPDVFYQWLQLSSSSCTKEVFIRLQDAPHTIENWPQVRYIAIWTQHTRELNIYSNSDSCPIGVCVDPCEVGTPFAAPDSQIWGQPEIRYSTTLNLVLESVKIGAFANISNFYH